jgi:hypothetical protein
MAGLFSASVAGQKKAASAEWLRLKWRMGSSTLEPVKPAGVDVEIDAHPDR